MTSFRLKKGYTAKQTKGLELLAIGQKNHGEIAKEIGVSPSTISKWKKDPQFIEDVIIRAREILKQSMPDVYAILAKHAKSGNDKHIKIYLDHLEKLESIRAGQASITFTWNPTTHTEEGIIDV